MVLIILILIILILIICDISTHNEPSQCNIWSQYMTVGNLFQSSLIIFYKFIPVYVFLFLFSSSSFAFQHNPALQPRAMVVWGCISKTSSTSHVRNLLLYLAESVQNMDWQSDQQPGGLMLVESIVIALTRLQPLLERVCFSHCSLNIPRLFDYQKRECLHWRLCLNEDGNLSKIHISLYFMHSSCMAIYIFFYIFSFVIFIQDSPLHKLLFWVAVAVLQLEEQSLYAAGLQMMEQNIHCLDEQGAFNSKVKNHRKFWKVSEWRRFWGWSVWGLTIWSQRPQIADTCWHLICSTYWGNHGNKHLSMLYFWSTMFPWCCFVWLSSDRCSSSSTTEWSASYDFERNQKL